jgi:hypothetical protein
VIAMTEAEWLACTDPKSMLRVLQDRASDRKLRLFDCACCRRAWHLLTDPRSRTAVEVAERFVDGAANAQLLSDAFEVACDAVPESLGPVSRDAYLIIHAAEVAAGLAYPAPYYEGGEQYGVTDFSARVGEGPEQADLAEEQAEADLVQDIFGNPFRLSHIDPAWLAWNDGTVVEMAQTIYDDRAFDRLSILADALEEAGCTDDDILTHCRGPGPHALGCWVVDLLLGKT